MLNSRLKSERGRAQVWGTRKGPGRFNLRLAKPVRGRAFFMDRPLWTSKEGCQEWLLLTLPLPWSAVSVAC